MKDTLQGLILQGQDKEEALEDSKTKFECSICNTPNYTLVVL